jgi:SAM-dependent methyltransferase
MEASALVRTRYSGTRILAGDADPEYVPFPDVARRNGWQQSLELPTMVWALQLPGGGRVLEVGCGRGVALPVLARLLQPRRLVGLDVDTSLLGRARERVKPLGRAVELRAGDVRELPFADASFDLVVDFGTCYHVARRAQALREVARVLADGGRFVHETRLSQLLSHPVRSWGRELPWDVVAELVVERRALLWASRVKRATSCRRR